jgi:SPP1 family predicted phage head-tail adaptor
MQNQVCTLSICCKGGDYISKHFNPGSFRHKITLLLPPGTQDDYGQPVDDYTKFKTVYASKEPLLGNELFAALTTESRVKVKFRTRYIGGVTDAMSIKHGTEIYKILSLVNVESRNKELIMYCRMIGDD